MISASTNSSSTSQRNVLIAAALLFAASAALTITWCDSMSAMHDMPMPGGWTMSMMWMRMPGQSAPDSAAIFIGMWLAMTVAMMLPSLLPMLWRYRSRVGAVDGARLDALTAIVAVGYFFVWTAFGAMAYVIGSTLSEWAMHSSIVSRCVPVGTGIVIIIAGALQFSRWKMHHLACCRGMTRCCETYRADAQTAWSHGLRLGAHCVHCCFGLTAVLIVIGVMNLYAMALVTIAISAERIAKHGERVARWIGVVLVVAGLCLTLRAMQ
ncbi:MAG: DUF2182 domain-containing protein [Rudaea sp.]